MKYVEIRDGLSVRVDAVEAVGRGENEFKSVVYTFSGQYQANFPYKTMVNILEGVNNDVPSTTNVKPETIDLLDGFLKNVGTFAG